MNIAVVGTGYGGLATGVSLSEIGHKVICVDIDERKIEKLRQGISPIYVPGLDKRITKNMKAYRLFFTTNHKEAFNESDAIYIAVGTPENEDGSASLIFVEQVAEEIAKNITKDTIVVTKSNVPAGTNHKVKQIINSHLKKEVNVEVISNPAIYESFHGNRMVIGTDSEGDIQVMEEINQPTVRSAGA